MPLPTRQLNCHFNSLLITIERLYCLASENITLQLLLKARPQTAGAVFIVTLAPVKKLEPKVGRAEGLKITYEYFKLLSEKEIKQQRLYLLQ